MSRTMSILVVEIKETLPLAMSLADAASACQDVLKSLGWKIEDNGPDKFTAKDTGHMIGRPRHWVISLVDDGSGGTTATLHGSLPGGGPLIKAQLNKSRDKLRAAITQRAGAASP
jgi:hypothetical protein